MEAVKKTPKLIMIFALVMATLIVVTAQVQVGADIQGGVILSPPEIPTLVSNASFNASVLANFWDKAGLNAPPIADWNMGGFGFINLIQDDNVRFNDDVALVFGTGNDLNISWESVVGRLELRPPVGQDITILFQGDSNSGRITWDEDENQFQIPEHVLITTLEELRFGSDVFFPQGKWDLVFDSIDLVLTNNLGTGELKINSTINVSRNISVDGFYFGNGSQITDVCLSNGTNCEGVSGGFDNTNISYVNNTQTFTAENNFSANVNMESNLTVDGFIFVNGSQITDVCLSNGTNCQPDNDTIFDNTNVAYVNNTQSFTGLNNFTENVSFIGKNGGNILYNADTNAWVQSINGDGQTEHFLLTGTQFNRPSVSPNFFNIDVTSNWTGNGLIADVMKVEVTDNRNVTAGLTITTLFKFLFNRAGGFSSSGSETLRGFDIDLRNSPAGVLVAGVQTIGLLTSGINNPTNTNTGISSPSYTGVRVEGSQTGTNTAGGVVQVNNRGFSYAPSLPSIFGGFASFFPEQDTVAGFQMSAIGSCTGGLSPATPCTRISTGFSYQPAYTTLTTNAFLNSIGFLYSPSGTRNTNTTWIYTLVQQPDDLWFNNSGSKISWGVGQLINITNLSSDTFDIQGNLNGTGEICDGSGNCLSDVPATITDTNASTECTSDQILLGNTSCMSITKIGGGGHTTGFMSITSLSDSNNNPVGERIFFLDRSNFSTYNYINNTVFSGFNYFPVEGRIEFLNSGVFKIDVVRNLDMTNSFAIDINLSLNGTSFYGHTIENCGRCNVAEDPAGTISVSIIKTVDAFSNFTGFVEASAAAGGELLIDKNGGIVSISQIA